MCAVGTVSFTEQSTVNFKFNFAHKFQKLKEVRGQVRTHESLLELLEYNPTIAHQIA